MIAVNHILRRAEEAGATVDGLVLALVKLSKEAEADAQRARNDAEWTERDRESMRLGCPSHGTAYWVNDGRGGFCDACDGDVG